MPLAKDLLSSSSIGLLHSGDVVGAASSDLIPGNVGCIVPAGRTIKAGLNARREQSNHTYSDHQNRECYGIVVEPMPLVHEMPPLFPVSLVGLEGRKVQIWSEFGRSGNRFTSLEA
jgi:hypothetical protein